MDPASRTGQHSSPAQLQESLPSDQHADADAESSQSSTTRYKQEPFETFRFRALALARRRIWPAANPADIKVEHLEGGTYNRIVGVTNMAIQAVPIQSVPRDQIVRIPRPTALERWETANVQDDAAILLFVESHSHLPVPRAFSYDRSGDNPIQAPYLLIERLPGDNLCDVYNAMTHEQRIQLAREMGLVYRHMLTIQSTSAGNIRLLPGTKKFLVKPLAMEQGPFTSLNNQPVLERFVSGPPTESVHQCLTGIFRAEAELVLERYPEQPWRTQALDLLCQMVDEMQSHGFLKDVRYCLAHRDFAARNLLVDLKSGGQIITAILDWDMAMLVPEFVACKPPCWLWRWSEDQEGGTNMWTPEDTWADEEPSTRHGRDVKDAFDKGAGETYQQFAYHPAYRLARTLFQFVLTNIGDFNAVEKMLTEWAEFRKSI